ncbi:MAG: hypothetical protein EAZ90_02320 [Oscillatoriales cyanobacterium]|nr:MAG: hypothetical protein EAZ90_02320 [Oscillatoriales cyanobacterium]TAG18216.1 MAG: hypothetical protein EAZ39_11900 [Oscillatoriales cyanobacterium]TAG32624.1 MAG: hypothetical protein EAZ33_30740 [Oscillatoriales cyanobacterium]
MLGLGPSWFNWLYKLSVIPHLFEKGYISKLQKRIGFKPEPLYREIKIRQFEVALKLSTVNCQLSTVNCQLSTVNCQLSTVN